MRDVLLTRELRAELHHPSEIAGLARRGELTHLRRGSWSSKAAEDAEAGHRQLIRATVPQISSDAVLSHVSAGLLYGLPLLNSRLDQVHWTRSRYGGGRSTRRSTSMPRRSPRTRSSVGRASRSRLWNGRWSIWHDICPSPKR